MWDCPRETSAKYWVGKRKEPSREGALIVSPQGMFIPDYLTPKSVKLPWTAYLRRLVISTFYKPEFKEKKKKCGSWFLFWKPFPVLSVTFRVRDP